MKLACLIIIITSLFSSQRYYVWTYGNQMMEKGESELEIYSSYYDYSNSYNKLKQYIELEVGMNDRLDAGVYLRYSQINDVEPYFKFDGYKLKTRYRLFKVDKFKWNPILYFESYMDPDFSITKFEHKLILTRNFGNLNLAFNPTIEFEFEEETEIEVELYSAFSYKLNPVLRLGLEFKLSEYGDYIGPTL